MAKRRVIDHPKTKRLARQLDTIPGVALGLLETIWHWVGEFRKDGALTVNDLEDALDSGGWLKMFTAAQVIESMTNESRECILLDCLEDGRFFVHDWHLHADDAVNAALGRARLRFANGAQPSLKRLSKEERGALEAHYEQSESNQRAQNAHDMRTESALPEPKPENSEANASGDVAPEPTPFEIAERMIGEAHRELGWVAPSALDIRRHLKPDSPIQVLAAQFGPDVGSQLFVWAYRNWTQKPTWKAVCDQRNQLFEQLRGIESPQVSGSGPREPVDGVDYVLHCPPGESAARYFEPDKSRPFDVAGWFEKRKITPVGKWARLCESAGGGKAA